MSTGGNWRHRRRKAHHLERPLSPAPRRPVSGVDSTSSIDISAWRRELAPIYPEAFLANRSDAEIIELVRGLGRVGVSIASVAEEAEPFRVIRRSTAADRKRKFLDEAVEIEQTSA